MQHNQQQAICDAALSKFGYVIAYIDNGAVMYLACERRDKPRNGNPTFCTIEAAVYGVHDNGVFAVDFRHGSYDLTDNEALADLYTRAGVKMLEA